MKLEILSGIAAIALLIETPALAADMPVKAAPSAASAYGWPPGGPAFDWSGFYIGGDVGWQGSRIGLSSPTGALTYAATHDSLAGGGFIGVQRQFGQIVLGVEGDYLTATGRASLGSTPDISIFGPGGTGTGQVKLRDIWSVGARVGWAMGRWMPYAAGGYANGAFKFSAQNVAPALAETETAKSSGGTGYLGVGIDWAATNNWIIGAEYRHYGFATQTATGSFSGAAIGTGTEQVNIAPRTDTVLARVSYKFDWPH
jgi:outer membrane immunogenic protein